MMKCPMGKNLQKLLKKKKISRKALSRDLDIRYSTICEWINNGAMPRYDVLMKVSEYLDESPSKLLCDDDEDYKFKYLKLLKQLDAVLSKEKNIISINSEEFIRVNTIEKIIGGKNE